VPTTCRRCVVETVHSTGTHASDSRDEVGWIDDIEVDTDGVVKDVFVPLYQHFIGSRGLVRRTSKVAHRDQIAEYDRQISGSDGGCIPATDADGVTGSAGNLEKVDKGRETSTTGSVTVARDSRLSAASTGANQEVCIKVDIVAGRHRRYAISGGVPCEPDVKFTGSYGCAGTGGIVDRICAGCCRSGVNRGNGRTYREWYRHSSGTLVLRKCNGRHGKYN